MKRGELSRLDALPLETDVTIVAEVLRCTSRALRARRGSMQEVLISDGTGTLSLVFFNQPFITDEKNPNALVPGRRGLFSGKVKLYKGMRQLAHPQHQMFTEEGQEPPDPEVDPEGAKRWEETPLPIYPATAALTSWKIEKAVELALDGIAGLDDPMPLEVCRTARLMGYEAALRRIHRPAHDADWIQAKRTLRFHEAFLLQTALLQRRAVARDVRRDPARARGRAATSPGSTRRCRSSSPTTSSRSAPRSWPTSRATPRCTACCRARSPPARRSSRCGRCSPSPSPAASPRCSRRRRCSPRSTSAPSRASSGPTCRPS